MDTAFDAHTSPESPGLDPARVCTLSPDGRAERMAWIRERILPRAIETVRLRRGLAFELAAAPGLAEDLDRLIEQERACCSDIVFARVASATPGRLRLEVRGIDPDAAIFRSLAAPLAPVRTPVRLAKAAATGVVASLVLCCVVPVAAVALLGTAAAPLASLDGVTPLAAGAILAGTVAWWWLGRRRADPTRSEARCGPGC